MKKAEHLSEEQFNRYRHRTLAPAELLEVDRHIAQCEACLARLWRESDAIPPLRDLRSQLSEHLDYDRIVACAEGASSGPCARHMEECELCRAEVDVLRDFRAQLTSARRSPAVIAMPLPSKPRRISALAALAAGTVLAAGLGFWALRRQPPAPAPAGEVSKTKPPAEPALSPEQQAMVQLAVTSRKLERAQVLDRLIARRGVLLGSPGDTRTFEIGAPMGTAVLTDRPSFRWETVESAAQYVVSVFDADFRKVAESPALTATAWHSEQPLARGRIYNWQVTATAGGATFRSPVPPAPEARFQVVAAADARSIETARRDHPGNHLLLAVLMASVGALDDATAELEALASTDAPAALALRESLNQIRKP
jgi:hypothetical protein